MGKQAFISHVSEETAVASRLKAALTRDFLGLVDVFVSSDGESIAAGDEWLSSLRTALEKTSLLLILCSPQSIKRPWINFETGAAWMSKIPLMPLCHAGLTPQDLPILLSLSQSVLLSDPGGLTRLYDRLARELQCKIPVRSFEDLANEIKANVESTQIDTSASAELRRERAIKKRLIEALQNKQFKWRTLQWVATEAGISEDQAAEILRAQDEVKFSKGRSGKVIVGLVSRVRS
jgi:hypothetical protein